MIIDPKYKDHLTPTEIKHIMFEIFNEKISSVHNNIPTKNIKSNVENTARENGNTIMYVLCPVVNFSKLIFLINIAGTQR